MTAYPMQFEKQHWEHRGGTKDYTFYFFQTADNKALIVKRWGKVGSQGQFQVHKYNDVGQAQKDFATFQSERLRKGYTRELAIPSAISDANGAKTAVGRFNVAPIGADAWTHIDPSFDTTGMKPADPPTRDEEGNFLGRPATRRVPIDEEATRLAAEAKAAEERKELESHPLFGKF